MPLYHPWGFLQHKRSILGHFSYTPESLRDEKVKVLRSIRPIHQSAVNAHAFRAQYAAGRVNDEQVPGYLDEPDVPANSVTETYAALKLFID